jgi:glycosyltransferase involved in cell wall biosynthesis
MDKVYVITPTVGSEHLQECIESIQNQSYSLVNHIVVVDGPSDASLDRVVGLCKNIDLVKLPWNTGGSGFLGGCIYSAVSQLIDNGFVLFLDDDNHLDRDHI